MHMAPPSITAHRVDARALTAATPLLATLKMGAATVVPNCPCVLSPQQASGPSWKLTQLKWLPPAARIALPGTHKPACGLGSHEPVMHPGDAAGSPQQCRLEPPSSALAMAHVWSVPATTNFRSGYWKTSVTE